MRRGSIVRITIYSIVAGILASIVAVLIPWLPTSASEEMDRIEFTFWFTTVICIGVFAVVAAAIAYSILKFRVQPEDDSDGAPIHGHTGLEIVWTAIPAVLVTAISVVSAIVLAKNDDPGPNPIRIAVTGQQFAWRFEYPGEPKVVSGELVLPLGEAVKLTLHSLDVIHAFWVPEFGQKSDAVPGIETTLVITPNRKGSYAVVCTELCGLGHATMRAPVRVVDRPEYERFLAGESSAPGGDPNSGETVFATAGCGGCHAFEPAGSDAEVGPGLDQIDAGGAPLEEFIREGIVDPNADLAQGYQPDVMPNTYDKSLTAEQLDRLVQYLVEGQQGGS
ncbi:MAG: cytochrome c oxidase subunit II [Actinomycetota bacterium]|nr:cytochrome c oxidase subunit II [Actinomycetota bacterium]